MDDAEAVDDVLALRDFGAGLDAAPAGVELPPALVPADLAGGAWGVGAPAATRAWAGAAAAAAAAAACWCAA